MISYPALDIGQYSHLALCDFDMQRLRRTLTYLQFVSDIAIFVLKRDVKLQLTNLLTVVLENISKSYINLLLALNS